MRKKSKSRQWVESLLVYSIPSGSMIPTLQVGDRIFVNKFVYGLARARVGKKLAARTPARGEVVVFVHPRDGIDLIERACVEWRDSLGEATFVTLSDPNRPQSVMPEVKVPAGSIFVMGDNRDNSSDSRYWGFVPIDLIKGRAMFVWWSSGGPDGVRWSRIGHVIN